jgi:transposase-like protein
MEIKCISCDSNNTIFVQIRKNKSGDKKIYRCKECEKRFVLPDEYNNFRHPPVIIKSALIMLEKGNSLAQVSYYLNRTFRIVVTRKTIFDWKRKFLREGLLK